MQETCKAFSPLRLSEAGKEGAGPQSPAITPVRVEFVCPKEFDLAGLEVFDADGNTVAPLEGMPGKPMKGVYWLSPGSYTYNFKTGVEGYQDLTAVPFTVEKDASGKTIEITPERITLPEESEDAEDAQGEEAQPEEGAEAEGEGPAIDQENIEPIPAEVTTELVPERTPARPGAGLWTGALVGLLIGAALGCAAARLLQRRRGKKAGGKLSVQARAVQGVGARQDQQDALYMSDGRLYDQQGILMCVADGMGGLSDGAKMSQAVVSAVERGFAVEEKDDPERLIFSLTKQAAEAANQAISPNYGAGGSTMVLGYLRRGEFTFASVGDSRISLYRDGTLWHLNRRHVYGDEMVLSALNGGMTYETATMDRKKAALTSYLGMGRLKYTDLPDVRITLHRGDRIILMSDGVFNTLSDEELAAILSRKIGTVTGAIAEQIKARANRYQDNFTAIVVAVD